MYARRKNPLGKAVEMTGVSYESFLEMLAEAGIDLTYDEVDLEADIQTVLRKDEG